MKSDTIPIGHSLNGARLRPGGWGPASWLASAWLVMVIVLAITADFLPMPPPDRIDWNALAVAPGPLADNATSSPPETRPLHLLGTDTLGRDILSRLVFGARTSLSVGILSPLIAASVGALLGMLGGFYRGRLDALIVGIMDVILAFPGLVLLLAVTFCLGPGRFNLILALSAILVPAFTRVARAHTLSLAEKEFVRAARMLGAGDIRILFGEVFPNIAPSLAVYGLYLIAVTIVVEGALSFLGLSVPPPSPSWGGMIAEGKEVLDEAPYISLFPASIMFFTILSFNLLADALRESTGAREGQL